jgi:hypothetical protein
MRTFVSVSILLAALLTLGVLLTPSPAYAVQMCQQSLWTTTCRNDDGTWIVCGLHGSGCEPLPLTGQAALPGMTPAPSPLS